MASRKQFLGFADGLVTRFVSRNNDVGGWWGVGVLSKRLHDAGRSEAEFDLLSGSGGFGGSSALWLRHRMEATKTPREWLGAASLRVVYTSRQSDPSESLWPLWIDKPKAVPMYRAVVTATLIDNNGRVRQASAVTWCWDHDPMRENVGMR